MSFRLPLLFLLAALGPLALLTQLDQARPTSLPFAEPLPQAAFAPAVLEKSLRTDLGARAPPDRSALAAPPGRALDTARPEDALFEFTFAFPDHDALPPVSQRNFFPVGAPYEPPDAPATSPVVQVLFIPPEPTPLPSSRSGPAHAYADVPLYADWLAYLRHQPRPRRADEFLPRLKRIFAEQGVPEELAWLPEVESMFDPTARNRVGARGLFQFMPLTAAAQGLRLQPYDERVHPEKSAVAAAVLLRRLHESFDSWPLALAAYNAGETRVRRLLRARNATTFAEIARDLPSETRHYVPRVLATLALREGVHPSLLAAPRLTSTD